LQAREEARAKDGLQRSCNADGILIYSATLGGVTLAGRVVSVQLARNATIGSFREALRAGKYPARAATTISSTAIPNECDRIGGGNAKQHAFERIRQSSRRCHSQRQAQGSQSQRTHKDAALQVSWGRPQDEVP
jgi:hypothetical protein